jgi:methionine sulfoxide reductase catalytic subunit
MPTPKLPSSEITPEAWYLDRRKFLVAAGVAGAGLAGAVSLRVSAQGQQAPEARGTPYGLQPNDQPTPYADVTGYNNFYEFGTGKEDPAKNCAHFRAKPWTVKVDGLCDKPGDYALEDFLKPVGRSRTASTGCAAWRPGVW